MGTCASARDAPRKHPEEEGERGNGEEEAEEKTSNEEEEEGNRPRRASSQARRPAARWPAGSSVRLQKSRRPRCRASNASAARPPAARLPMWLWWWWWRWWSCGAVRGRDGVTDEVIIGRRTRPNQDELGWTGSGLASGSSPRRRGLSSAREPDRLPPGSPGSASEGLAYGVAGVWRASLAGLQLAPTDLLSSSRAVLLSLARSFSLCPPRPHSASEFPE